MNIRRTLAAVGVAGAAVLIASPAGAVVDPYEPTEVGLACEQTQVPVNTVFTCVVTSDNGFNATLTTGGSETVSGTFTKPLQGTAPNLSATFTVTATGNTGPINITASVDGVDTNPDVVTVVAATADTGYDGTGLAIGAGVALAGGAGVLAIAAYRRRQNAEI